jgi:hypothetical protein
MLGPVLRNHRAKHPGRPFVCIIHGDEFECHGKFLERLQYHALPQMLGIDPNQKQIRDFPMRLPRLARQPADLWPALGDALMQNSAADAGECERFLSTHPEPMMIPLEFLTDDFDESSLGLLPTLLQFCNDLTGVPHRRDLLFFLSVKYQRPPRSGFLDFRKPRRRKINDALQERLRAMKFADFDKLTGIVLPELRAVPQSDVQLWRSLKLVRERCWIDENKIRDLYARKDLVNPEERIEMERLAEELKKLMPSDESGNERNDQ